MTPTMRLRFVERLEIDYENSSHEHIAQRTVCALQQWWEGSTMDMYGANGAPGEWRDVPLEREA